MLVAIVSSAPATRAEEYTVEFDCFRDNPSCQQQSSFTNRFRRAHLNEVRWGSAWKPEQPHGAEMTNDSGGIVMAVRVRALNGDTFAHTLNAGGHLFTDVWRKADGTEMIFNNAFGGAGIPDGKVVWNRVSPGTPTNPYENLRGQISRSNFDVPGGNDWVKLELGLRNEPKNRATSAWKRLETLTPEYSQAIRLYEESDDGRSILFLSGKKIFLYDDPASTLLEVYSDRPVPVDLNRISSEKDKFVLWRNGNQVIEIDPRTASRREIKLDKASAHSTHH